MRPTKPFIFFGVDKLVAAILMVTKVKQRRKGVEKPMMIDADGERVVGRERDLAETRLAVEEKSHLTL